MIVQFKDSELFPNLRIGTVRGTLGEVQWEIQCALQLDDLRQARDRGELRRMWRLHRERMYRQVQEFKDHVRRGLVREVAE